MGKCFRDLLKTPPEMERASLECTALLSVCADLQLCVLPSARHPAVVRRFLFVDMEGAGQLGSSRWKENMVYYEKVPTSSYPLFLLVGAGAGAYPVKTLLLLSYCSCCSCCSCFSSFSSSSFSFPAAFPYRSCPFRAPLLRPSPVRIRSCARRWSCAARPCRRCCSS